ncbi:MAG: hypothetical protein PWQ20_942 [Thermotogaceae bacterium]|nr:hypothetical protein [Thermotogaceae bacterium]MDN5337872.1 hypothetical protein [Thermotogaceae bacterium]
MKLEVLLVIGGDYHDFYANVVKLVSEVREEYFNFEITDDMSHLNSKKLAKKDIVALYALFNHISSLNKKALLKFVEKGGGFLGLHSANASFLNDVEYQNFIGSKFLFHPEKQRFKVNVSKMHFITLGLKSFEIFDELYVSECSESVNVLLEAEYQNNKVPILYTKSYGLGKIAFFALGHDEDSILNENFIEIFIRSLKWLGKKSKNG